MTALAATEVLDLALAAGFSRADANVMAVIAHYESGWNPNNVGDTGIRAGYESRGLWQIWQGAWPITSFGYTSNDELFDPAKNAHAARVVFRTQGFTAWSTYNDLHKTSAWASLLTKVAAIGATPTPPPTPKDPILNKASKSYWVNRGNHSPTSAAAFAFARRAAAGPHAWSRLCLSFVRQALGAPGMGGTAVDAWNRCVKAGQTHTFYTPPPSVPVFWSGGAGHVVLTGPDAGMCWSNDIHGAGVISYVSLAEVDRWLGSAHKRLGWTSSVNGVSCLS